MVLCCFLTADELQCSVMTLIIPGWTVCDCECDQDLMALLVAQMALCLLVHKDGTECECPVSFVVAGILISYRSE